MLPWTKRGLIFVPDGSVPWMHSHATMPVVEPAPGGVLRIYFGSRDDQGRSRIGLLEAADDDPGRVLRLYPDPLLPLGERGTFDDCGLGPSCLVDAGGCKFLYYIGCNPGVTVSYRMAIGLAVSEDGIRFRRYSTGPILDRDPDDPYFCSAPWVLREDGRWRMWYVSCTGWEEINGHPEPSYHIKYAESADGIRWRRTGRVCIDSDAFSRAAGRPCVVAHGGGYHLWYGYRGLAGYRTDPRTSYRLGYAVSADGLSWTRRDGEVGLGRSGSGWDADMVEYAHVLRIGSRWHCFYNGNGFGRSGFGYASCAA
jgi:predicted GH43/DUF377 family glycosyl hydrolase